MSGAFNLLVNKVTRRWGRQIRQDFVANDDRQRLQSASMQRSRSTALPSGRLDPGSFPDVSGMVTEEFESEIPQDIMDAVEKFNHTTSLSQKRMIGGAGFTICDPESFKLYQLKFNKRSQHLEVIHVEEKSDLKKHKQYPLMKNRFVELAQSEQPYKEIVDMIRNENLESVNLT